MCKPVVASQMSTLRKYKKEDITIFLHWALENYLLCSLFEWYTLQENDSDCGRDVVDVVAYSVTGNPEIGKFFTIRYFKLELVL